MESIIITITTLLLLYTSFGGGLSADKFMEKAQAENIDPFPYHLTVARHESFPYRVKGEPLFNPSLISAESAIVIDEQTGRVLFEKDSYDKKSIASLTKMMSALVWWEIDGDMDKIVEIKSEDYREGGIPYFVATEKVRAKDLLHAGLVASSNSAMAALVRSTGIKMENFVYLMNKKAKELGMKNTRFKEPTGLDFKNISTAVDIFILTREIFKNPIFSKITQLKEYSFRPKGANLARNLKSTNWLLADNFNGEEYKILGGKTGYIDESGYNLALKVYNKEKDRNLIIIILGSMDKGSRFDEAKTLAIWTYKNHIWEL